MKFQVECHDLLNVSKETVTIESTNRSFICHWDICSLTPLEEFFQSFVSLPFQFASFSMPAASNTMSDSPHSPTEVKEEFPSLCCSLCCHLLSILGNFVQHHLILNELFLTANFSMFFDILLMKPPLIDCGLIIIQRQLLRTLSKIILSGIREPKWFIKILLSEVFMINFHFINDRLSIQFAIFH
jgi:hypothetical protein